LNQSRTEAHKEFAKLYRKQRSEELQQKVNEAIGRTNDVFIRIDLIKKIDEESEKLQSQERIKDRDKDEVQPHKIRRSLTNEVVSSVNTLKKEDLVKETKPVKKEEPAGNLFANLFSTSASSISDFAKQTGTLDIALLTRKPSISEAVKKIFRTLSEMEILSTITAFKYAEQIGWKIWPHLVYNIVNNFGKFFNAFVSLDSLFRDDVSVDIFLAKSQKMQMYYIRHIHQEDAKNIIFTNLMALVKQDKKLQPREREITSALEYTLNLQEKKPSFTDAICAFYIVDKKKLIQWKDIELKLRVAPIKDNQYSAPAPVMKQIILTYTKLKHDIDENVSIIKQVDNLKKMYFHLQKDGKINFDFINNIINAYIEQIYPEHVRKAELFSSLKSSPHILLQILLRDLHNTYLDLLNNFLKAKDSEHSEVKEIRTLSVDLFYADIERLLSFMRTLENFNRQYSSFQYSFQTFNKDIISGSQDPVEAQVLKLIHEAAALFGILAKKLNIIVQNHKAALVLLEKGEVSEKLQESQTKEIEELKMLPRFLPAADFLLVSKNRLNGRKIFDLYIELTSHLYNYAVLYKDRAILDELTIRNKIEAKIQAINKDYMRLTGVSYIQPKEGMDKDN
jgi:hypothetical protein